MLKTILLLFLKIIGIAILLVIIGVAIFYYQYYCRKSGYDIGWRNVYYDTQYKGHRDSDKVEGADTKTFEVFKQNSFYGKDKNRVYFKFYPLPESDPSTFSTNQLFDILLFCRDKRHVYFRDQLVSRDANHFEQLSAYYYKDSKYIYRARHGHKDIDLKGFDKVEGIDYATFQALTFPYCRDENQVFFRKDNLPGLNPDKLRFIIGEYGFSYFAMDDNLVYFYDKIVPDADPSTLKKIESNWWKDKNQVYYWGEILPDANPKTFQTLKGINGNAYSYSKDDRHVYYKGRGKPKDF